MKRKGGVKRGDMKSSELWDGLAKQQNAVDAMMGGMNPKID
jgi:hypothetical protein